MALRFRKSIKLAPGLRWNLSGSGSSCTFGPRGASINVGSRGTLLNAGIGAGLSSRTRGYPLRGRAHAAGVWRPCCRLRRTKRAYATGSAGRSRHSNAFTTRRLARRSNQPPRTRCLLASLHQLRDRRTGGSNMSRVAVHASPQPVLTPWGITKKI